MKPSAPASGSHSLICLGCKEGELSSGGKNTVRCPVCGHAPGRDVLERNRVKEMRSAKMICVTVEIREGTLTHQARVTAHSIECALKIVSVGKPGRRVHLVFPIDPEAFFVPRDHDQSEELPPVSLYKGGGFSFVLDGRRHVSVASYHGVEWIDAHVTEFGATGLWSKRRERAPDRTIRERSSEPKLHEMMDSRIWKQRREQMLREVERNRRAKALRAVRKRRHGRRSALVWEMKRQAGCLLKFLRKTWRNAGY